jgi:hypothetical protein
VAIADVYDALVTQRVYKPAYTHEQSVEFIREGSGSQFDPVLVDLFLDIQSEFRDIAQRCANPSDGDDTGYEHCASEVTPAHEFGQAPLPPINSLPAQTPQATV